MGSHIFNSIRWCIFISKQCYHCILTQPCFKFCLPLSILTHLNICHCSGCTMEFIILILVFPDTGGRWECSTFFLATGLSPSELPFYITFFSLLGWFSYLLVRQTVTFPLKSYFPRSYLVTDGGALCSPYIWFVIGFKFLLFMFKSLFCLEFIFRYEVLLVHSSLISLPYYVSLLGLIYNGWHCII